MKRSTSCLAVLLLAAVVGGSAGSAQSGPLHETQSNADFAASAASVTNVSATTQRTSCYRPELVFTGALPPSSGYPGGGSTECPDGTATTGENTGAHGYDTQDEAAGTNPVLLVKDHSESDIRVDPTRPGHLIGQSKWIVNAEGYNHLLGFYESFDGGATWPVQGHVPGYEGWTDNTDPVGAFDPYGNFYSLLLPYSFYYDKSGFKAYNNGSKQVNQTVPPEAVAVSVRPHTAGTDPNDWITTHGGHPDYVTTAKNANTYDPDKQWIAIDTNSSSPCFGTIYAMYSVFKSSNPSITYVSTAKADTDGSGRHSDWTTPQVLPTRDGKPWDSYVLPHIAPDGTVYTTLTNQQAQQGFSNADIDVISSPAPSCGRTWTNPLPVASNVAVPTYQNTTFREGIVNTFGVGSQPVDGVYPLYVSYEDGSSGVSNIWLTASYDRGHQTWTPPILVNDNVTPVDELQPNLAVDAATGKVALAFYDRRLNCEGSAAEGTTEFDPAAVGAANYCVDTAVQFYDANLNPIGHNVRLSTHTMDPQLNAPHPSSIGDPKTFIGDYFGIDWYGNSIVTTSVSTYDFAGENPNHYQQQIVARAMPPLP
jgi:hypothetical protein